MRFADESTKGQEMKTNNLMNAGSEEPSAAISTAPPLPAAGMVQLLDRDERHLEVRYYDVPDKYRVWLLPREDAQDLVRWWVEQGANQTPQSRQLPEQRFGRIFVSLLSQTEVYCRSSTPLGAANVTGYQFPRAVLEVLSLHMRPAQDRHPQADTADTETLGGMP